MGDRVVELSPPAARRIAVAGNPNSGKTTLFNALTGLRSKVANYPGVTVEKREGLLLGTKLVLVDLPGTYSLSARSPDEEIARDLLLGRIAGTPRPDAVLLVVDASNLERNLYVASQLLDYGMPMVIACNMADIARESGLTIDFERLGRELGARVVPTVASKGEGVDELRRALKELDGARPPQRPWRLSSEFEKAADFVAAAIRESALVPDYVIRAGALLWLMDYLSGEPTSRASADRFLARVPPTPAQVMRQAADDLTKTHPDAAAIAIQARYEWITDVVKRCVVSSVNAGRPTMTDRIDGLLTHRVIGLAFFAVVMLVLFVSIFAWAEPLMDAVDAGRQITAGFIIHRMAPGPLRSLLTDGVLAGVGAVLSFFPQICILFFCLGLIEDTGYMARAAFLMDKFMSRVGLHGKSFIPLLSSYACAIPGILATRTIENRRDRFTTILVAPLQSCSARLPVYLIVIAAVFGDRTYLKAGLMFGLYAIGTLTALLMALLFKKTLFAGPCPPFIMELPPYHLPRFGGLLRGTWDRSKLFLTNAGTTIFAVCVAIWALSYYPELKPADYSAAAAQRLAEFERVGDAAAKQDLIAGERLRHSYIGRLGRAIEPVISPLGFDYRIGIGVLSSFIAREVFVGTMGVTFSVGATDESSPALRHELAVATWPDGRRVLTPLAGVSLLVFYVLACQCVSTLAVVRKETGSWKWPALMFAYMTVLAYAASLVVYQVGSRLGIGAS